MKRRNTAGLIVDPATSQRLAGVRQHDTAAELLVRRTLYRAGLRYRIRNRDLPGSPDVANRRHGWAIFVHGCFWHRHSGCHRATTPKRNRTFWLRKFKQNVARDRRVRVELEAAGYLVFTIWECEAKEPMTLKKRVASIAQKLTLRQ